MAHIQKREPPLLGTVRSRREVLKEKYESNLDLYLRLKSQQEDHGSESRIKFEDEIRIISAEQREIDAELNPIFSRTKKYKPRE